MIRNDLENFLLLKPVCYRFLKSIRLERDIRTDGYGPYDIEIIMCNKLENNTEDLKLRFSGAFGVKLGDLNGMWGLQIEISDVANSQIEGAKFEVIEAEEEAFSFYCREFSAELVCDGVRLA